MVDIKEDVYEGISNNANELFLRVQEFELLFGDVHSSPADREAATGHLQHALANLMRVILTPLRKIKKGDIPVDVKLLLFLFYKANYASVCLLVYKQCCDSDAWKKSLLGLRKKYESLFSLRVEVCNMMSQSQRREYCRTIEQNWGNMNIARETFDDIVRKRNDVISCVNHIKNTEVVKKWGLMKPEEQKHAERAIDSLTQALQLEVEKLKVVGRDNTKDTLFLMDLVGQLKQFEVLCEKSPSKKVGQRIIELLEKHHENLTSMLKQKFALMGQETIREFNTMVMNINTQKEEIRRIMEASPRDVAVKRPMKQKTKRPPE